MPDCRFCGKETSGTIYCSRICLNKSNVLQKSKRRQLEREKRNAENPKICVICKEKIDNTYANQLVHNGDCKRLHMLQLKAKSYKKLRALIPVEIRTCKCGHTFAVKATSKQVQCQRTECINWQQREKLKTHKRVIDHNAVMKKIYALNKIPTETRDARCPGCRTIHKHKFDIAWLGVGMPWIRCDKYPSCISQSQDDYFFEKTHEMVWESSNGASL